MTTYNKTNTPNLEMGRIVTSPAGFNWPVYTQTNPDFNRDWGASLAINFVDDTAQKYVAEALHRGWRVRDDIAEHRVLFADMAAFRAVFIRVTPDGTQERLRIGISSHYTTADGYRVFLEYNNFKYYTHFANEGYAVERPTMAFDMLEYRLSRRN